MYVKAFIVNVNKCPKTFFFLVQHINIVNRVTKAFGLSVAAYPTLKEKIVVISFVNTINQTHYSPILTPEGSNVRRVYLVVSS